MAHLISCRDCSDQRTTLYRNTRYCIPCRLLRDLAWLEAEQRRCRSNGCTTEFLPVSKKDLFCGKCASLMASDSGRCKFCEKDAPLHRGMGICTSCVRDPGERARVIAGLRNGQTARQKTYHHMKTMTEIADEVQAL